jgi:hypothetical protein
MTDTPPLAAVQRMDAKARGLTRAKPEHVA